MECAKCGMSEDYCRCDNTPIPWKRELLKVNSSGSIAGLAGAWSKELPTDQGWYWWWNEDPDDVPIPVSILASGMDGRCFASKGQFGWTRHQYVEEMRGRWIRLIEPELPAC